MTPDLRILENRAWWAPYHPPKGAEGAVLTAGGIALAAAGVPNVLIFEEKDDAVEYLSLYARKMGGDGPDMSGWRGLSGWEPQWEDFVVQALLPSQVQNVLIDSGHVPVVVHHAWAGSVLSKLRNQGLAASTNHAVMRHAALARRLHEGKA